MRDVQRVQFFDEFSAFCGVPAPRRQLRRASTAKVGSSTRASARHAPISTFASAFVGECPRFARFRSRTVHYSHRAGRMARTIRSKGCLSNKTALVMVFKLVEGAQKSWRRLDSHNQLPRVIEGVKFTDGIAAVRQDV